MSHSRGVTVLWILLALALVCGAVAYAQSPELTVSHPIHISTKPGALAPFTDLEAARLDALAQEGRALDAEQRILTLMRERWQGKVSAFKVAAEASRPGWTWDAESGKWSEVKK